jgi:hypothetical protein
MRIFLSAVHLPFSIVLGLSCLGLGVVGMADQALAQTQLPPFSSPARLPTLQPLDRVSAANTSAPQPSGIGEPPALLAAIGSPRGPRELLHWPRR